MGTKEFNISPLTPIWTGNLDRDSSRLRVTGLIGSLRWWYAGLIRGLGGKTCGGQANEESCPYEYEKIKYICPVCRIFGCTGQARRFRLTAEKLQPQRLGFTTSKEVYRANSFWLWQTYGGGDTGGSKGRDRDGMHFRFGVNCLWGETLQLHIGCSAEDREKLIPILTYLLSFLSNYGGLGAKIQNGYGIFELNNHNAFSESIEEGRKLLRNESFEPGPPNLKSDDPKALNIRNFFSYEFELKNFEKFRKNLKNLGATTGGGFNPCAFDLRYKYRIRRPSGLRDLIKFKKSKSAANEMLGNSKSRSDDERWASRVYVGHPFKKNHSWHLRVYGYIPPLRAWALDYDEMTQFINNFYIGKDGIFPDSTIIREFNFDEEFSNAN